METYAPRRLFAAGEQLVDAHAVDRETVELRVGDRHTG